LENERTQKDTRFLHVGAYMSDGTTDEIEVRQEMRVALSQHEEDRPASPLSHFLRISIKFRPNRFFVAV